ncbi:DUF488 domain-containing protein [Metallosphaera tengchongensis]|uniref:DUF488 domain-containing protein n=1 Tax=Metallosphaera tengchongensis TaxID=1532350 RepID=A0A6N0NQ88_9CREN|nr:DUF488 domain-containing protein [Metallosphaera tengchongensis]QKQ99033.1 DUF488 domain-containing protein [Metallosphaera tengchongensis]
MTIKVKRVYESPSPDDGIRILVDRLWPRGLSKEKANVDIWLKEIAPSDELRRFFSHDPNKWEEFKAKYFGELKTNPALKELIDVVKKEKMVTLLFSARDEKRNNAVALKQYLEFIIPEN